MALALEPLPTKTRTSFDIPALLKILEERGEFATDASFEDLLVVRNYIERRKMPFRLSQKKVWEGYVIKLVPKEIKDD